MPESQQLSDVGLSATSDTLLQLLARFTNVGQTSGTYFTYKIYAHSNISLKPRVSAVFTFV